MDGKCLFKKVFDLYEVTEFMTGVKEMFRHKRHMSLLLHQEICTSQKKYLIKAANAVLRYFLAIPERNITDSR